MLLKIYLTYWKLVNKLQSEKSFIYWINLLETRGFIQKLDIKIKDI